MCVCVLTYVVISSRAATFVPSAAACFLQRQSKHDTDDNENANVAQVVVVVVVDTGLVEFSLARHLVVWR